MRLAIRLSSRSVQVALARPRRELQPGNHALWVDLREELLDDDVDVLPIAAVRGA